MTSAYPETWLSNAQAALGEAFDCAVNVCGISGADFASLARRYSEDAQSAAKGGDLGWVSGEELGGELAQAIAKLPDGGISKPIRAPYGYHILLVRGHRQSDKSEDMMRQQIKRSLYNKAIEDAWQQRLQALRREAYVDIR